MSGWPSFNLLQLIRAGPDNEVDVVLMHIVTRAHPQRCTFATAYLSNVVLVRAYVALFLARWGANTKNQQCYLFTRQF